MPITSELTGDLITFAKQGRFDAIAHGCNCFCRMKSGIAPKIARAFVGVEEADQKTMVGDRRKLGSYSFATQPEPLDLTVFNMYTQFSWGTGQRQVDYEAVAQCFEVLNPQIKENGTLGIPLIGCGLAGGRWRIIKTIIDEVTDYDVTVVYYE